MAVSKADQAQLIAFLENQQDIEVAREVFKDLELKGSEIVKGGVKEAIETFLHKRSPKYLIVDISNSVLAISDLTQLSELCEPGVAVIAIGVKNDVGLYRDLMKLGIVEYLVSPIFPEILGRAIKNAFVDEDKGKEKRPQTKLGKIISVVGSRGGVGSTFITTNFASILSSEKSRRVVVIDLDLHFGTISLYLNLKVKSGLKDALENPDDIDAVFIERLLTSVDQHLFVLSSEEPLEEQLKYKVDSIEMLLTHLSKLFHYVIIDIPHYSDNIIQMLIKNSHIMLLVTDPSLAGLRDSGRLMRLFGEENSSHRVILIMNKSGGAGKSELPTSDFEQALSHKIKYVLPYDPSIPMECVNQGKTLAGENNALAHSIREIVDDVLGIRKAEENTSGLKNFFKRIKLK